MKRDIALDTLVDSGLLTDEQASLDRDPEATWDQAFQTAGLDREHPARAILTSDAGHRPVTDKNGMLHRLERAEISYSSNLTVVDGHVVPRLPYTLPAPTGQLP